jgi:hypothetical protein
MCALDKLYSPVYKLYSYPDAEPDGSDDPNILDKPKDVTTPTGTQPDFRMYYRKGEFNVRTPPDYPPDATSGPVLTTAFQATEAYEQFLENPFEVEITEVKVNNRRLHNHLHFTIGFKNGQFPPVVTRGLSSSNVPGGPTLTQKQFGKISYAFIIVHDQNGWPIGDFNTRLPCGQCGANCVPPNCHQAEYEDTIPCMILSKYTPTVSIQFLAIPTATMCIQVHSKIHVF